MRKLIILFLLFSGGMLFAQQKKVTISGSVIAKADGSVLAGANVIVYNTQGNSVAGASADVNGAYNISGLTAGNYVVEASFVGYAKQSKAIWVAAGAKVTVDFTLVESYTTADAIVVTGGRRSERVSESSSNVQVVDAKMLAVKEEPTISGLLKNVNGIDYFETGMGQQQVNARGFYSPFTGNMLMLIDYRSPQLPGIGGVFPPALGIPKEDIRQVEVIVGPNSALYGANASAGVINIITKGPREDAGTSINVSGGNQSMIRAGIRTSGLLGDKFGYKIAANYFKATDFSNYVNVSTQLVTTQDDPARDDPDFGIKNTTVNGSLYFYPTHNIAMSYTGGVADANYINQSNIGRLQVKNFRFWFHQVRANIDNLFGNWGSVFLQAYVTQDDAGDTYNLIKEKQVELKYGLSAKDAIAKTTFVDKPIQYVVEMQHNFSIGNDQFITWGAQWQKNQPNSEGTFLSDGPNGEKIDITQYGVYAQYENAMAKNFKFTLTGRYDNNSDFGNQFSPKAAVSYHSGHHNITLAYVTGFASPAIQPAYALSPLGDITGTGLPFVLRGAHAGFTLLNTATGAKTKIDALKPTKTSGFELNYKASLIDGLYTNLSLYKTQYDNFLSPPTLVNDPAHGVFIVDKNGAPIIEGTLSYINFGKVDIQGVEVGAEMQLTNGLSANLAFNYQEMGSFKDVPANISSTPTFNAPNRTWKGGLRWVNWWKRGTFANVTFRYVTNYFFTGATPTNTGTVPTYNVVDLNLDVPMQLSEAFTTHVGISVNNLLNNEHIELPGSPKLGLLVSGHLRVGF